MADPTMWAEMVGIALAITSAMGVWLRWLFGRQDAQISAVLREVRAEVAEMRLEHRSLEQRVREREMTGVTRAEMTDLRVELRQEIREGFAELRAGLHEALTKGHDR